MSSDGAYEIIGWNCEGNIVNKQLDGPKSCIDMMNNAGLDICYS